MKTTDTLVQFELGKLLKEKGFDGYCNFFWYSSEYILSTSAYMNHNHAEDKISRPFISQVVMWLNDKHDMWINVDKFHNCFNVVSIKKYDKFEDRNTALDLEGLDFADFTLPTEAYVMAIWFCLSKIE